MQSQQRCDDDCKKVCGFDELLSGMVMVLVVKQLEWNERDELRRKAKVTGAQSVCGRVTGRRSAQRCWLARSLALISAVPFAKWISPNACACACACVCVRVPSRPAFSFLTIFRKGQLLDCFVSAMALKFGGKRLKNRPGGEAASRKESGSSQLVHGPTKAVRFLPFCNSERADW